MNLFYCFCDPDTESFILIPYMMGLVEKKIACKKIHDSMTAAGHAKHVIQYGRQLLLLNVIGFPDTSLSKPCCFTCYIRLICVCV